MEFKKCKLGRKKVEVPSRRVTMSDLWYFYSLFNLHLHESVHKYKYSWDSWARIRKHCGKESCTSWMEGWKDEDGWKFSLNRLYNFITENIHKEYLKSQDLYIRIFLYHIYIYIRIIRKCKTLTKISYLLWM